MRFRFLALLGLIVLAVGPAAAEDIRYPSTGVPALTMRVPSGWFSQKEAGNNLMIGAKDHSILFAMSFVEYSGSPDLLASEALKVANASAPTGKTPVKVAGVNAFAYRSNMTNPSGMKLNLKLIVVQVDPKHVFTCTLITNLADGDKKLGAADALIAGMKVVRK